MGSQTTVPPKGSAGQPGAVQSNPFMSFMPMIVVCAILYFLVIRPQQKQAKDHRLMVDALKQGDRVLTQGGIYGTVVSLRGGIVQIKIADNVRIDVARSAITQVITESANGTQAVAAGQRPS
jgi:preprotein translocase subunit YajC